MTTTLSLTAAPGQIGAYARLAKLDVWDYYLALPLALSLADAWFSPAAIGTLVVFLLGTVAVISAAVAFDDVTGFCDGSDRANYGRNPPARRLARKPLLTGELTVIDAVRFGWACAATGAALWAVAIAIAPFSPLWSIALIAVCLVTAVQYSWGVKLSYRGWQEVFLVGFGAGLVLGALGLISGGITAFAVVQAVLFGLGPLLFGVYSNTRDANGDARVGRATAAALLSPQANRLFIAALSVAEIALIVLSAGLGAAPWWFSLAMLPAIGVRIAQMRRGIGIGDVLGGRTLGLRAHRVTAASLIIVNLLAPILGTTP